MSKSKLIVIAPVLILGLIVGGALVFFDWNPFREGEITIALADGTSMTLKVANSSEISEVIREGLNNDKTSGPLASSLLGIIEELPSNHPFSQKLMSLAETRRPPFKFESVPVKLLYGNDVPEGLVAVCENSRFSSKNIVIFVLDEEGGLVDKFAYYADTRQQFPCEDDEEKLRLNLTNINELSRFTVLAKRTL